MAVAWIAATSAVLASPGIRLEDGRARDPGVPVEHLELQHAVVLADPPEGQLGERGGGRRAKGDDERDEDVVQPQRVLEELVADVLLRGRFQVGDGCLRDQSACWRQRPDRHRRPLRPSKLQTAQVGRFAGSAARGAELRQATVGELPVRALDCETVDVLGGDVPGHPDALEEHPVSLGEHGTLQPCHGRPPDLRPAPLASSARSATM